jgi:hypothetical protein
MRTIRHTVAEFIFTLSVRVVVPDAGSDRADEEFADDHVAADT